MVCFLMIPWHSEEIEGLELIPGIEFAFMETLSVQSKRGVNAILSIVVV